jgi:DNA-binding response OmpR family regulator
VTPSSILIGKRILVVDDEPDILSVVEGEILFACPDCMIDKATSYKEAHQLLDSHSYDLVILDIMGVNGFELLGIAVNKGFRVAMLTAHALSPEALKKSHDLGARAYLPKDEIGQLVPFLEDIMRYEYKAGWNRLMQKLEGYFDSQFEDNWKSQLFPFSPEGK